MEIFITKVGSASKEARIVQGLHQMSKEGRPVNCRNSGHRWTEMIWSYLYTKQYDECSIELNFRISIAGATYCYEARSGKNRILAPKLDQRSRTIE